MPTASALPYRFALGISGAPRPVLLLSYALSESPGLAWYSSHPDIRRIHQNFLKIPISSIFTHVTSVFDLQPSFDLRTFISVLGLSMFELLHSNVLRYFLFFQTGCSFFPRRKRFMWFISSRGQNYYNGPNRIWKSSGRSIFNFFFLVSFNSGTKTMILASTRNG